MYRIHRCSLPRREIGDEVRSEPEFALFAARLKMVRHARVATLRVLAGCLWLRCASASAGAPAFRG